MIVITRNGKSTVITGWRAWLLGATAFAVAWLLLIALTFIWIGTAITLGLLLLLALPALLVVGVVQIWLGGRAR